MSLPALKEILDRTGGRVKARGPQEFKSTLNKIRESTAEILVSYEKAGIEISAAEQDLARLQSKSANIRQTIRSSLSELVIMHTFYQPQPLTEWLLRSM